MPEFLIVDNSTADAALISSLLIETGATPQVCPDCGAARQLISAMTEGFAAAFVLWDVSDLSFADLLAAFRERWPETLVFVMFDELTAEPTTRARRMGAKEVLEKPLSIDQIKDCLRMLPSPDRADPPIVKLLNQKIRGQSPGLLNALRQLALVIQNAESNVLLLGESGTGKELFARAIHEHGPNPKGPWVAVQVSAIPETLFESHMFGHEKGAHSEAKERQIGLFEQANGGTIFLDEIGELPQILQVKLLRVLQEKSFRRLGGDRVITFRARLVCATNADLDEEVKSKRFRLDLHQRINTATIYVPPLRERPGDIAVLARHFLDLHRKNRQVVFADSTLKILGSHLFSGNARELENVIIAALTNCEEEIIRPRHLPMLAGTDPRTPAIETMPTIEAAAPAQSNARHVPPGLFDHIVQLLPENWLKLTYREAIRFYDQAFDRIYLSHVLEQKRNITQAAKAADLDRKTFREKWKNAGLRSITGELDQPEEKDNADGIK